MEQQEKKKNELSENRIRTVCPWYYSRSISISIRFETHGRENFESFSDKSAPCYNKSFYECFKSESPWIGPRVNRESCGISIEFIHAGQSYHRLGQSLWHLIPNTFPMVALYTDSVNQRLIGWPTCDTPLFPKSKQLYANVEGMSANTSCVRYLPFITYSASFERWD